MRLIDADKLLIRIGLNYSNHQKVSASDIKDIIDTTKTAYNVDKVVEELKERSKEYNSGVRLHGKPEEMLTDDAIDTVKRGGVE